MVFKNIKREWSVFFSISFFILKTPGFKLKIFWVSLILPDYTLTWRRGFVHKSWPHCVPPFPLLEYVGLLLEKGTRPCSIGLQSLLWLLNQGRSKMGKHTLQHWPLPPRYFAPDYLRELIPNQALAVRTLPFFLHLFMFILGGFWPCAIECTGCEGHLLAQSNAVFIFFFF